MLIPHPSQSCYERMKEEKTGMLDKGDQLTPVCWALYFSTETPHSRGPLCLGKLHAGHCIC